jgi:hypothetical protein
MYTYSEVLGMLRVDSRQKEAKAPLTEDTTFNTVAMQLWYGRCDMKHVLHITGDLLWPYALLQY